MNFLTKHFLIVAVALFPAVPRVVRAADETVTLPPPVPYLNTPENFFMGNGYAGGGGAGDGTWNFLTGPD